MQYDLASAQVDELIKRFDMLPEQVATCMRRTLDRTCEYVKTAVSEEISREKRIKLKIIRDRLKIVRGNVKDNYRIMNANFSDIFVRSLGPLKQTAHGASVDGNIYDPHSFIAKFGYEKGVYVRVGKERIPVRSVRLPIYTEALAILQSILGEDAMRFFRNRFEHEFEYIMENMKKT